jgi:hypothetical protein
MPRFGDSTTFALARLLRKETGQQELPLLAEVFGVLSAVRFVRDIRFLHGDFSQNVDKLLA